MSLHNLENFLRRLARVVYGDDLTPILMDYLIRHLMAEDYSAAYMLKLEDKLVRQCFERLEKHGILKKKQLQLTYFHEKFANKIGFDPAKVQYPTNLTKVTVYCFHKDLLFIVKARLYTLKNKLLEKIQIQKQKGQSYLCQNSTCVKATKGNEVKEIDATRYSFKCSICSTNLITVLQEDELQEAETRECMDQVNSLEDELKGFGNYKVPPHFFGLGIQQVDYIATDGLSGYTESIDDIEFKINLPSQSQQTFKQLQAQKLDELADRNPNLFQFYRDLCTSKFYFISHYCINQN